MTYSRLVKPSIKSESHGAYIRVPEEGGSKQRAEVLVAFGEDDVDILETLAAGN